MSDDHRHDFILEKYKYVLSRKRDLNDATFKIVAMYQAGLALLVSGQFAILAATVSFHLEKSVARAAALTLFALMCILTMSSLLLLGGWNCCVAKL